jgi:DNA-directed RNA polymerase I subunit RPA1
MNVHFPQDEISRAEAMNIVDANKQYIGPRSGDAVRGLIQVYYATLIHNFVVLILLCTVIIN